MASDHSFDNDQSIREASALRKMIRQKSNVYELNLICFEYVLLSFPLLLDWIYAKDDEFRSKRKRLIVIREKLLDAIHKKNDYKKVPEIVDWLNQIKAYNIEQITAKLLFELTRNTGFEVNKSNLGICWKTDCCKYEERESDDVCGLDDNRLTLDEKMKTIMRETFLQSEFVKAGLEVQL